jgi:environmental stress-induced protein Ves
MPLEIVHLPLAQAREVPWKNGRGLTREVALWPPESRFERGDFHWRLAAAGVTEDGPFSPFAGFERLLLVTSGRGLRLSHGDDAPRAAVPPLQPYRFEGEWATRGELVDGPVTDLNLLLDRERCAGRMDVLRLGRRQTRGEVEGDHWLLHLLSGAATLRLTGEERAFPLAAGDTLWVRGRRGEIEYTAAGASAESCLVLIGIQGRGC